jgi:hypothetical protein
VQLSFVIPSVKRNTLKDMSILNDQSMKCPTCDISFFPDMQFSAIGRNGKGQYVYVYYQMCPECKEPIIGVKEGAPSGNIEGVTLLKRLR